MRKVPVVGEPGDAEHGIGGQIAGRRERAGVGIDQQVPIRDRDPRQVARRIEVEAALGDLYRQRHRLPEPDFAQRPGRDVDGEQMDLGAAAILVLQGRQVERAGGGAEVV